MRVQLYLIFAPILFTGAFGTAHAQSPIRTFPVAGRVSVEIVNHFGRVEAAAPPRSAEPALSGSTESVSLFASSPSAVAPNDLKIVSSASRVQIEVLPTDRKQRIDIKVTIPAKSRLKIDTVNGEVRISGDVASAEVRTDTGTIAADVPTEDIRYTFLWTAARPRYLSDFELAEIKEKAAGKFRVEGRYFEAADQGEESLSAGGSGSDEEEVPSATTRSVKRKKEGSGQIQLDFQTERGIVLLNIPPNEVSSDLRERPLTNAAKAIIRSGDSLLMEAIRRAVPKYYSDYMSTLPPLKLEPRFAERPKANDPAVSGVKVASVRVSDANNRAIGDLTASDFEVLEGGTPREVVSVRQSTAPFNLVLLLDVSGSVENYVNFIRKAARNFVNTVDTRDRIAIISFNDDVHIISKFTTDKAELSTSLDTFDAGGATAYYDALAYTLADTLRPLRGERTAIVVLTDGDDNRSFLPFDSMLSSIEESGALIYPLYVPTALAAGSDLDQSTPIDTLRSRYLHGELTSKAKNEGERLAKASGGVYYEISRLSQIQAAYEDIVRQLRTSYEVEYRSEVKGSENGAVTRLRIRINRPNTYVQIRSVEQRSARK